MKVKTTKRFTDLKENIVREIDAVFEVTNARYQELIGYVVEVKEEKKAEPKKKAK